MAKVALALTKVTCADGTTDYNVGLNPNTNACLLYTSDAADE